MTRVTVSDEQREQIRAAAGPVELVDAAGAFVGRASCEDPEPTLDELRAELARPGRLPPAEVLARLRGVAR